MASNFKEFRLQLIDSRTKLTINDDIGQYHVLTAGSPTEATIYVDSVGTVAANPSIMSGGVIRFFVDDTVSSVDITILTADGYSVFLEGVTRDMGRVDINVEQRSQVLVMPFLTNVDTEVDTGFDLPANLVIKDCFLKVTTVDATETLDVGLLSTETGGDTNGFMALASMATAGLVTGDATINDGATSDFFNGGTYGVLLASQINGSDAAATSGGQIRKKYLTDGVAKSVVYDGSAGSDTGVGYIFLEYDKIV